MSDFTFFYDLIFAIVVAVGCSLLVRRMTETRKLPKWWFWIAIIPLLSIGLAISITLFPRTGSPEFNAGRADFVALIFYGFVLPVGYLCVSVPIALILRAIGKRTARS